MIRFFKTLSLVAFMAVAATSCETGGEPNEYVSSTEAYSTPGGGEITLTKSAFYNSMFETSKIYASDSGAAGEDFDGILFYTNDGMAGYNAKYVSQQQTWVGFAVSQNFATSIKQSAIEGTFDYKYEFFAKSSHDVDYDRTFVVGHYIPGVYTPTITFDEPQDLKEVMVALPSVSLSYNPSTMMNDSLNTTLVATAYDAEGEQIGEPVSIEMFNKIYEPKIRWWQTLDLSELDGVSSLEFTVESENPDVPTYLCIDALAFR